MKIELKKINIRELSKNYVDNTEEGVIGYDGKLDIRPKYQREFIYDKDQRSAVIDTVKKNFPLNVMYWNIRDDGNFEVIDGQQRTVSICQYINGDFTVDSKFFHNLQDDEQKKILDYELHIYQCSGTDSERLDWFRTINIAGEELTDQELRNAVYSGSWVSDAKRYFSKSGCAAYNISKDYVSGSPIRQDYLETAIRWISKDSIEEYMGKNQHKQNASLLWQYYQGVIVWIESTFKVKRREMKGLDWGSLYDKYKDQQLDTEKIESEIKNLILDDDVTKKGGIYPYILTRDQKHLSIRSFTDSMKSKVYEKQNGICAKCKERFELSDMDADHITPWIEGGRTVEENCQLLCKKDNRTKSDK